MNPESVQAFIMRAPVEMRRIRLGLPPLPPGWQPRQIHVIEALAQLEEHSRRVTVGDIARAMDGTTPSITKLIQGLVTGGYIQREQQEGDRRFVVLHLTEAGRRANAYYGVALHRWLASRLSDVTDADIQTTLRVLHRFAEETGRSKEEFAPGNDAAEVQDGDFPREAQHGTI